MPRKKPRTRITDVDLKNEVLNLLDQGFSTPWVIYNQLKPRYKMRLQRLYDVFHDVAHIYQEIKYKARVEMVAANEKELAKARLEGKLERQIRSQKRIEKLEEMLEPGYRTKETRFDKKAVQTDKEGNAILDENDEPRLGKVMVFKRPIDLKERILIIKQINEEQIYISKTEGEFTKTIKNEHSFLSDDTQIEIGYDDDDEELIDEAEIVEDVLSPADYEQLAIEQSNHDPKDPVPKGPINEQDGTINEDDTDSDTDSDTDEGTIIDYGGEEE